MAGTVYSVRNEKEGWHRAMVDQEQRTGERGPPVYSDSDMHMI